MLKRLLLICFLAVPCVCFAQSAALKYIEQYKEDAIKKMNEFGVPASIILGVAMHESGSGTSKISKYLNNHFGMKGKNQSREIRSSYKGYESASDSYDDFIHLLKDRGQFNKLFEKYGANDYTGWARGIQRGGYASSKTWSRQVLAIIDKYELYKYDAQADSGSFSFVKIPESTIPEALQKREPMVKKEASSFYRVKQGDTLSEIAEKLGTSVKQLRLKNNLKGNHLSIGQKLKL